MKHFFAVLMAFLLWGCTKVQRIEFTVTTPGIDNGVFTIKTPGDSTIYGENIQAGKLHLDKVFQFPGYYSMVLSHGKESEYFDVYLESGKYTITTNAQDLKKYPLIKSTSGIQNQLSDYHHLFDAMNGETSKNVQILEAKVKDPKSYFLPGNGFNELVTELSNAQHKESKSAINALAAYVEKYPDNKITLHIMQSMNYESDPATYYKIFQKINAADKNSDDGKELGGNLTRLISLAKGGLAPAIAGTTPDGKTVDLKALGKKVVLVEFWRVGSAISRDNHQGAVLQVANTYSKDLAIVSVSLDAKRDWWTAAIKADKMTWTQVSDLKGDDSPNVTNWIIHDIPTYYLLDGSGHIIERDIPVTNVDFAINDYLKHH